MFLHIGDDFCVSEEALVLVLDADTATRGAPTRKLLEQAQKRNLLVDCSGDLPRSVLVCREKGQDPVVYLSRLSAKTLGERAREKRKERH